MDAPYEDPIITCPIDEVHRIAKSKLQKHLVKCLKANGLGDKMVCPFNPLHIIYIVEKEVIYQYLVKNLVYSHLILFS